MIHRTTRTLVGIFAAGFLLTGCSGDPAVVPDTSPSAAPSTSTSAEASSPASPSATLSAEEQKAFDEATEVVLAYEQAFYEILASADPQLNDLNYVATQPQLGTDLKNLQQILTEGNFTILSTGPTELIMADPVTIDLAAQPAVIVLDACVDQSGARGTQNGAEWTGPREAARYRVTKTDYLPPPSWAISKVLPPAGNEQPTPC